MTGKKALRIPDYLRHMLQAIKRIETYADGVDQSAFFQNTLVQDAVIRNMEIIGEAASNILKLASTFDQEHPGFELKAAYSMRNSLSHGYFLVDPIWCGGRFKTISQR